MNYTVAYSVMTQNQPPEDFTNPIDPDKICSASNQGKSSVIEWKQGDLLKDGKKNEYEIQRVLGTGGFGTTYLAQIISKEESLSVVLKTLNRKAQEQEDDKVKEWYKEDLRGEGNKLMKISGLDPHPANIVKIIDNTDLAGLPCLVMEYVEGENLAETIKKGKLSSKQALKYIIQISKSLIPVHKKGINHRDIKPENIILTKNRFVHKLVLVDFGTARDFLSKTTKTKFESKGFTAPEQLLGKTEGAYTDVFSLAMTLYALVTGNNKPEPNNLNFPDDIDPKVKDLILLGTREKVGLGGRPKDIEDWLGKLVKPKPSKKPVTMPILLIFLVGTGGLSGLQFINNQTNTGIAGSSPEASTQDTEVSDQPLVQETSIEAPVTEPEPPSLEPEIAEPTPAVKPVKVYQRPEYGFQISYPEDWYLETKEIDLEGVSFEHEVLELTPPFQEVTSPRFDSRVYVEVMPHHDQSLKQIADLAVERLNNKISPRTVLAKKDIQLNGVSAYEVTYTGQEEGAAFQRRQILIVSEDWQYWLTYEAPKEQFSKFEAEAEQILRSFSL